MTEEDKLVYTIAKLSRKPFYATLRVNHPPINEEEVVEVRCYINKVGNLHHWARGIADYKAYLCGMSDISNLRLSND